MRPRPAPSHVPGWVRWCLIGVGLSAYAVLTWWVVADGSMEVDRALLTGLAEVRSGELTSVVLAVSALGAGWPVAVVAMLGVGALLPVSRRSAAFLGAAMLGAGLLNQLMKQLVARPRPGMPWPLYEAEGYSFPSGHAMGTMALGVALVLIARHLRHRWQWRLLSLVVPLVAVMGVTRVYLGVHYPSDVLGAWVLGAAWVGIPYSWYRMAYVREGSE